MSGDIITAGFPRGTIPTEGIFEYSTILVRVRIQALDSNAVGFLRPEILSHKWPFRAIRCFSAA